MIVIYMTNYMPSFRTIENVTLNRGGKTIGSIVWKDGEYYYLSRRTSEHYFVKYHGFGVQANLFMKLLDRKFQTELDRKLGITKQIRGIIIDYHGKTRTMYFADMDAWFLNSIPYQTCKVGDCTIEDYGRQFVLSTDRMSVLWKS